MTEVDQALNRLQKELKLFGLASDRLDRRLAVAMKPATIIFGFRMPRPIRFARKIFSRFAWWRESS